MEQAHAHRTKTMPGLRPQKGWKCYKPEYGFSCRARDVGLDAYVECLETHPFTCPFAVSYGHSYFCRSPARIHMVKTGKG